MKENKLVELSMEEIAEFRFIKKLNTRKLCLFLK